MSSPYLDTQHLEAPYNIGHPTMSQQSSESNIKPSQPPPLPYNLREHKPAIIIAFSMMLMFDCLLQTALFYPLYFFSSLEKKLVFAVVVIPATWSFVDWGRRTWRMVQASDEYRPLGVGRWTWDLFHYNYTFSIPIITVFFSLGTAKANQTIFSLPIPFLLTLVGLQTLLGAAAYTFAPNRPAPIRFSSVPAGEPARPPVYTIVEDIVAVNGGGGKAYRRAINERYEASPKFRQLMNEMSWVWGSWSFVLGVTLIVLIGVGSDPERETFRQIVYGISWTLPWLCTAVASFGTIRWVQKRLREEKESWSSA